MRYGICCGFDMVGQVKEYGYDYMEGYASGVAAMDEKSYNDALESVKNSGIKCEAFNLLFPGDIKLIGEDATPDNTAEYIKRLFPKLKALGGEIVVFGSGAAKNIEDGCTYTKAAAQYDAVLDLLEEYGNKFDIVVTVEHLNKREANFITSIAEAFSFIEGKSYKHVKLLIDYYHMKMEGEDESIISRLSGELRHLHIADEAGRVFPFVASKEKYADFFDKVRKIGYNERVSIEAGTEDLFADAEMSAKLLLPMIS